VKGGRVERGRGARGMALDPAGQESWVFILALCLEPQPVAVISRCQEPVIPAQRLSRIQPPAKLFSYSADIECLFEEGLGVGRKILEEQSDLGIARRCPGGRPICICNGSSREPHLILVDLEIDQLQLVRIVSGGQPGQIVAPPRWIEQSQVALNPIDIRGQPAACRGISTAEGLSLLIDIIYQAIFSRDLIRVIKAVFVGIPIIFAGQDFGRADIGSMPVVEDEQRPQLIIVVRVFGFGTSRKRSVLDLGLNLLLQFDKAGSSRYSQVAKTFLSITVVLQLYDARLHRGSQRLCLGSAGVIDDSLTEV